MQNRILSCRYVSVSKYVTNAIFYLIMSWEMDRY